LRGPASGSGHRLADVGRHRTRPRSSSARIDDATSCATACCACQAPSWHWPKSSAAATDSSSAATHFADPTSLVERIRAETRAAIAHPYLALDKRLGQTIASDVVAGRLEEAGQDDPKLPDDGPQVIVDGQDMSWAEFGDLLKLYHGWSFELRLGGDPPSRVGSDPLERITARAPTAAEKRAAVRALRASEGAYILDSAHYPTPDQWAQRDRA
jgi:hypothetical protein